jgi:hypothetical protein
MSVLRCAYGTRVSATREGAERIDESCELRVSCPFRLRPPRCVSTGPVVVRLAEMANERERERVVSVAMSWSRSSEMLFGFSLQDGSEPLEGRPRRVSA